MKKSRMRFYQYDFGTVIILVGLLVEDMQEHLYEMTEQIYAELFKY